MNNPKHHVLFHESPNGVRDVTKIRCQSTRAVGCSQNNGSKKRLIRNPERTVSSTIYKTDIPEKEIVNDSSRKSVVMSDPIKTNLSAPNLNSALRIVKEINVARTMPQTTHPINLVDEGKVLQKVNFPYEEHLYHDLVALNISHSTIPESGSSARSSSRLRIRERDKEPQLSQFFTPSFSSESSPRREPPVHVFEPLSCDSTSIYQRMCLWNVRE